MHGHVAVIWFTTFLLQRKLQTPIDRLEKFAEQNDVLNARQGRDMIRICSIILQILQKSVV